MAAALLLDDARFFQRGESAVFRHGLQRAGGELHGHEPVQFGDPDALRPQIWREHPGNNLRDMLADAALFLGETATMNDGAFGGPCFGNAANFHKFGEWGGDNGGAHEAGQGEIPDPRFGDSKGLNLLLKPTQKSGVKDCLLRYFP